MTLVSGSRLIHFEILRPLGAGGMGEVYLARDLKLGRDVAIKVLPAAFLNDSERLARFQREARVLASLNHSNIAHIYGLEESDGLHFLVLEYVDGETLGERLQRGPLSLGEALALCRQIAEGLEAAHRKGIIHRDLKPANVKITREGQVKILDFGLAKALAEEAATPDISRSPTATSAGTLQGVILGTAPYMSPEQTRGQPLDGRTDIWSFGCVLYESLTGNPAFGGATVSDVIASILQREVDWNALPPDTPSGIHRLLHRCLEKDGDQRLQHIGDARIEIQDALREPEPIPAVAVKPRRYRLWMAVALVSMVVALTAVAVLWMVSRSSTNSEHSVSRFEITFPESAPMALGEFSSFALSPDGRKLVYVGRSGGTTQLFLRPLAAYESQPIPETQGALFPFFSPDGKSAGFFAGYALEKVSLPLGPAQAILSPTAPAYAIRGATWTSRDDVLFSSLARNGLIRANSKESTTWNAEDPGIGQGICRWPDILPGNEYALVSLIDRRSESFEEADTVLLDLRTGKHKLLIRGGYSAKYVPTGHVVFARNNKLFAIPFDLSTLEVEGAEVPVLSDVRTSKWSGAAEFSFSTTGTLAFLPPAEKAARTRFVWVDRNGTEEAALSEDRMVLFPELSPDGRRLAATLCGAHNDIWIYDFSRRALSRFTFGGTHILASWSSDGRQLTYIAPNAGAARMFSRPVDGSGGEVQLGTSERPRFAGPWSPDGKLLAFVEYDPTTLNDIYLLSGAEPDKPWVFLKTPYSEVEPVFSPDSKWIAYVSYESGHREVYVRPVSGAGPKWRVSTHGGAELRWPRHSQELFYREGKKMMAVKIQTSPSFKLGIPHPLFEGDYETSASIHSAMYDVTPDGQKFLMIKNDEAENSTRKLRIVLNWFDELKGKVPAR